MQMITKEGLIRQLREKGLKITSQRLAIIDLLVENSIFTLAQILFMWRR